MLNKEISRYVRITREYFPDSTIDIVTNGLLINRNEWFEELTEAMKETNTSFTVSLTGVTEKRIEDIKSILNEYGVSYVVNVNKGHFYKILQRYPNADPKYSYQHCGSSTCHTLDNGKLYTCSWTPWIYLLNEKYGTEFPTEYGFFDLQREADGWELIDKLERPFENCKYCHIPGQRVKWEIDNRNDVQISDWIVGE